MDINDKAKRTANFLICLFLVWLFYFGWILINRAFNDSDTCWLLTMGRWIVEHHSLPMSDPFSSGVSTFAMLKPDQPLVQYQWLSEILFYVIYHWAGLIGLLVMISMLSSIIFICLPYLLLERAHCHKGVAFGIIFSMAMLASFCLYVRPQMFSYLFLGCLIYLYTPSELKLKPITVKNVLAVLLIMLLWTNMHLFFPFAIIFIIMLLAARFLEIQFIDGGNQFPWSQLIMPVIAVLPTAINPWGMSIWSYVERLRKTTVVDCITELKPVQICNLHDPLGFYLILSIITYCLLCRYYGVSSLKKLGLVSPLFASAGIYMSLQHCKLMPITSLFMFVACIELISRQKNNELVAGDQELKVMQFWNMIGNELDKRLSNKFAWISVMSAAVLLGTISAYACTPVTMPQASMFFKPPFKAIEFLKTHRPAGKAFNFAPFGSVMILYLDKPDVFIDTRFSEYEPDRLPDSICIENCGYSWLNIWRKYNPDWAFVRVGRPIVEELHHMGWKTVYKDDIAVILVKP